MKREKGKRVYIYSYAAAAAAAAFGGRIDATNKIEEEEEEWKGGYFKAHQRSKVEGGQV